MEVICTDNCPPSMKLINGDCSCGAQKQKALVTRGQKVERRPEGAADMTWVEKQAQNIHDNVHNDYGLKELAGITKANSHKCVNRRAWFFEASIGTGLFAATDQAAAFGTEKRVSLG